MRFGGGGCDGLTDVAFGTDTAGSIRVPAACCYEALFSHFPYFFELSV